MSEKHCGDPPHSKTIFYPCPALCWYLLSPIVLAYTSRSQCCSHTFQAARTDAQQSTLFTHAGAHSKFNTPSHCVQCTHAGCADDLTPIPSRTYDTVRLVFTLLSEVFSSQMYNRARSARSYSRDAAACCLKI